MTTVRERIESGATADRHVRDDRPDNWDGAFYEKDAVLAEWRAGNLVPADEVEARIAEAVAARDEKWASWHDEKSRAAKERERYFSDGPGWRTHVLGASGAERAAKDLAQLAEWHRGCAAAIRDGGNHDG